MNEPPIIQPVQPPFIPEAPSDPFFGFPKKCSICESCGYVGWPGSITKGSILLELLLWLCFIIPGLIYSAWRITSRYKACRACHGHMIPISSPRGYALLTQLHRR